MEKVLVRHYRKMIDVIRFRSASPDKGNGEPKTIARKAVQFTTSNANPFKYSVSGIMGIIGWSGDCE